jgi:Cryptococcal mannosyltransferase 1
MHRPLRTPGRIGWQTSDPQPITPKLVLRCFGSLWGLIFVILCCTLSLCYLIVTTSRAELLQQYHDKKHHARRLGVSGLQRLDPHLVQLVQQLEENISSEAHSINVKEGLLRHIASSSVISTDTTPLSHDAVQKASNAASGDQETQALLDSILLRLKMAGNHLPCSWDYSPYFSSVCRGACLFGSNLHNSEAILPNYILQLLVTLSILSRGGQTAFVSIYESGSTDNTAAWLTLLSKVLLQLAVPHKIVTNGQLQRYPGQDRIEFLAAVRNEVLEPLLQPGQGCNSTSCPAASKVVFINDVYYCGTDVMRLLQYDADITCGLDFIKVGAVTSACAHMAGLSACLYA